MCTHVNENKLIHKFSDIDKYEQPIELVVYALSNVTVRKLMFRFKFMFENMVHKHAYKHLYLDSLKPNTLML